MANDAIKKETTQALIDKAKYTYEKKDGEAVIRQVKEGLKDYFAKKKIAAKVTIMKYNSLLFEGNHVIKKSTFFNA